MQSLFTPFESPSLSSAQTFFDKSLTLVLTVASFFHTFEKGLYPNFCQSILLATEGGKTILEVD